MEDIQEEDISPSPFCLKIVFQRHNIVGDARAPERLGDGVIQQARQRRILDRPVAAQPFAFAHHKHGLVAGLHRQCASLCERRLAFGKSAQHMRIVERIWAFRKLVVRIVQLDAASVKELVAVVALHHGARLFRRTHHKVRFDISLDVMEA